MYSIFKRKPPPNEDEWGLIEDEAEYFESSNRFHGGKLSLDGRVLVRIGSVLRSNYFTYAVFVTAVE